MKHLTITISFCFGFCVCMAQGTYSFVKLLGQANCNQPITTKKFYSKNGLCSQTIFLNSDFTYTSESGCEERSYVIMGGWKLKGDSVELSAFDTVKVPMICSISYRNVPNKSNKRTTFIIKDKAGKPGAFQIVALKCKFSEPNLRSL